MSIRLASGLCLILSLGLVAAGCGDNDAAPPVAAPEQKTVVCERLPAQPQLCSVTPGSNAKLLKGIVLTPDTVYVGGRVAVDAAGVIQCVGCDCADDAATQVTCPAGVISPGLINAHDHITFAQNSPVRDTGERYEHRHDWRSGLRGHTEVPVPGGASDDNIRWGELRFLFGGGTSVNGSGGVAGILRNLDRDALQEGLGQPAILYQTFPLADSGQSTQRRTTCNYGTGDTTQTIVNKDAYTPHIAEGIDEVSRNEFLCTTSDDQDKFTPGTSTDLFLPQTAAIHSVGLLAADYAVMATRKSSLIWSPRTNVSLYGDTAQVTTADRLGVRIALGTDWIATGSANMLRELKCASELNGAYYDNYFSDLDLWKMATINAAAAVAMDDAIGVLEAGKVADIAIFDGRERRPLRAIIDAAPRDVALVMRGGKALYGDDNVIAGLRSAGCDAFEMCGAFKQVCVQDETTRSWAQLVAANAAAYPAFYCGKPANEPTCKPSRPKAVNGSTVYTGDITNTDLDGDGIANNQDNCPKTFNPVRPLDNGKQADGDGDGDGDACDPCPLTANETECVALDAKDRDGDGRPDATDNCPGNANANQADGDGDGKGDVCDDCASAGNPGAMPCPASIYGVKGGTVPMDAIVSINNALVTGKGTASGFFIQVKETDQGYTGANNSGLFVFTSNAAFLQQVEVGGRVNVEGQITNFFGQIELSNVTAVSRVGTTTEAAPAPTTVTVDEIRTGGSRAVALESVLVRIGASTVTAVNSGAGEFTVQQGSSQLVVDDLLISAFATSPFFPPVQQGFANLTGVLNFRNNACKLEPRATSDLRPIARLGSFSATTAFIRNGATNAITIPTALQLQLTMPVDTDTTVTITSSDTSALTVVGGAVTIPAGQRGANVLLDALAPSAGVTLTATMGDVTVTTSVRVLTDTDTPTALTLTPASTTINPGATVAYTVTINVPAPVAGLVVNLASNPTTAGTLPASVTVPANQTTATFNYVDGRTAAGIGITATYAAISATATISVIEPPTGLVINEIDYDQLGTDGAEFVEIYNGTGADIDLAATNMSLAFVNGSNATSAPQYLQVSLAGAGTLGNGKYLVVGVATLTVAPGSTLYTPPGWPTSNAIQNGDPDGVLLFEATTGRIRDRLSYGNVGRAITNGTVTGIAGSISFVEGTPLDGTVRDVATTTAPTGALVRSPNGADTNNANADWKLSATITPGAANPTVP